MQTPATWTLSLAIDPAFQMFLRAYSKWQLVSAVSHRRMFIEGGYWIGSPADLATKKKVDACIRFAANPTFVDWTFLVANGVDYFFVDHAVSPHLVDWEPYATEVMSNKSATLLRLNLSLVESSTSAYVRTAGY